MVGQKENETMISYSKIEEQEGADEILNAAKTGEGSHPRPALSFLSNEGTTRPSFLYFCFGGKI